MGNVDERLKTLLSAVLKKLRISVKESTVDALVQFVKFGVVGLTNTLISYGLNVLVLLVLKPYNLSWD